MPSSVKSMMAVALVIACTIVALVAGRRMTVTDHLEAMDKYSNSVSNQVYAPIMFKNLVDHFDPLNLNRYDQRYWVNDEYVSKDADSAPIFLTLCCEGQCSEKWVTPEKTTIANYAKEFNGLLLAIEHRYYGASQPVPDWSLQNLKYLTMEQALADAAYFIHNFVNPTYNKDLKKPVFVVGGSYGGLMATSMRSYYPNLVYGAIAASGVYDARLDLSDLLVVAVDSLRFYGGEECLHNIMTATTFLTNALKTNHKEDLDYINSQLPLATLLTAEDSEIDRQAFFQLMTDNFIQVVQYNADGGPGYTVEKLCKDFSVAENKFEAYAAVHRSFGGEVRWTFEQQVADIADIKIGDPSRNMRQWWWQSSSAFGWFQPQTPQTKEIFGGEYDMEYFFKLIGAAFGEEITKEFVLDRINSQSAKLNQYNIMASNVIFTSGTIDVWRVLATARKNRDMHLSSYHIERTAHCSPLYQPQTYDVLALRSARQSMKNDLIKMIKQYPLDRQGMNPGPLPL